MTSPRTRKPPISFLKKICTFTHFSFILYVWAFCLRMSVYRLHKCPQRPGEGDGSPRTGVTVSCKQPCGFWKLISGLLEGQPVFLTAEYPSSPKLCILKTRELVSNSKESQEHSRADAFLDYFVVLQTVCQNVLSMPARYQLARKCLQEKSRVNTGVTTFP